MAIDITSSRGTSLAPSCEILPGGAIYFDRYLKLIDESQEVIHLHVYIFNNDSIGYQVQGALIRASQRGVKVFLVLDGIGCRHLPKDFLNNFRAAGIKLHFFSKFYYSIPLRMGRRLHHKLLVVDHHKSIVGGLNIADRYRGTKEQLPWLDFGVYVEGAISVRLHNIALKFTKRRNFRTIPKINLKKRNEQTKATAIRVLENDFFSNKLQIRRSYDQAIQKAERSLILLASYFLPSFKLLRLLEKTAARGVEVTLVLPHKVDVLFYTTAVKFLYGSLLKSGVRIYEYTPTILHAKVAVADGQWCTIGSYNLNNLSDLLSVELNVEIMDQSIGYDFQNQLLTIIKEDCKEIQVSSYAHVSFFYRWLRKTYYFGILLSIKLMYWLTDKNKDYQIE